MKLQFKADEWLHILMAMRVAQKVLTTGEHYTPAYDRAMGYRIIGELMRLVKVSPNQPQIAARIEAAMFLDALPDPEAKPVKKRRLNSAGFPVDEDDEVIAPTSWPVQPGPVVGPKVAPTGNDVPFNALDLSDVRAPSEPEVKPEPDVAPPVAVDDRRQQALETAVNESLRGLTQAIADIQALRESVETLRRATDDRLKTMASEGVSNPAAIVDDLVKLTTAHNELASSTHDRFCAVDEYVFAIEDKLAALKKKKA